MKKGVRVLRGHQRGQCKVTHVLGTLAKSLTSNVMINHRTVLSIEVP